MAETTTEEHICPKCAQYYNGTVSCPDCGFIPRIERDDYEPPTPCDPWRAEIDFGDGNSVKMTVTHSGERKLLHQIIRRFGGGERNGRTEQRP